MSAYSYPHMCRDGHQQIGHSDSGDDEMCPLCRAQKALQEIAELCNSDDDPGGKEAIRAGWAAQAALEAIG